MSNGQSGPSHHAPTYAPSSLRTLPFASSVLLAPSQVRRTGAGVTRRMQHQPKALGWPETYESPKSLLPRWLVSPLNTVSLSPSGFHCYRTLGLLYISLAPLSFGVLGALPPSSMRGCFNLGRTVTQQAGILSMQNI